MVIEPQFKKAEDFDKNGLARVLVGDSQTGKWGFIYR
jgi:hypothetical protein